MNKSKYDIPISIMEFILVLLTVIECNSVYMSISVGIDQSLLFILGGNAAAFLLVFLWIKKDRANLECIKDKKILLLALFLYVMLFYGLNVVNTDSVGYLGYFLFFTDAMIILYSIYHKNGCTFRLIYKLEQVVIFICVVSLVLWIGSSILELWPCENDLYIRWTGGDYYTNYLNLCVRRFISGDNTKNLGIFVEPPMFGLMLSFCIYTELFLKKKTNYLIMAILTVALISSRAILGIMVTLLAFFISFLELIRGKKYAKLVTVASILCIVAGFIFLLWYKRNTHFGSFRTHLDDFAATFKCWKDYIFLGCGYGVREPIEAYMSEFRLSNKGLSNSIGMVLAQGGLYLFLFYMIPFALLMTRFFKGNRKLGYWGGGAFALWVVVVFPYRLFCFFILGLGYAMLDIRQRQVEDNLAESVASQEKANSAEETNPQKSIGLKEKIRFALLRMDDNQGDSVGAGNNQGKNNEEVGKSLGLLRNLFNFLEMIDLKSGVTAVSALLLMVFSGWSLLKASDNGIISAIAAGICLLTEIVAVVLWFRKKTKLSSMTQLGMQAVLWLLMIGAGSLYSVADSLYRAVGMHIQDNWWMSILTVIVLYSVGAVVSGKVEE